MGAYVWVTFVFKKKRRTRLGWRTPGTFDWNLFLKKNHKKSYKSYLLYGTHVLTVWQVRGSRHEILQTIALCVRTVHFVGYVRLKYHSSLTVSIPGIPNLSDHWDQLGNHLESRTHSAFCRICAFQMYIHKKSIIYNYITVSF